MYTYNTKGEKIAYSQGPVTRENFEYEKPSKSNWYWWLLAFAILVAIIVAVVMWMRRRKASAPKNFGYKFF